jgi:NAD dependent epimerase/dehydratase family enzyme
VRAMDLLITREDFEGVVNLASPNPLPNRDFMRALRDAWGIRFGLPAPHWATEVGAFGLPLIEQSVGPGRTFCKVRTGRGR